MPPLPQFVLLWTDAFVFAALLGLAGYARWVRRRPALRAAWAGVGRSPSAMSAAVVLAAFALVGLLDSVHYRPVLPPLPGEAATAPVRHALAPRSALDALLDAAGLNQRERSYSAPLALRQFTKETRLVDGEPLREHPRLAHAGRQLADERDHAPDVGRRAGLGALGGLLAAALMAAGLTLAHRRTGPQQTTPDAARPNAARPIRAALAAWWAPRQGPPWRAMWLTASALAVLAGMALSLGADYHVLGTDRTGNDVLAQSLKSIRTALVIGTLTTAAMLPPALGFGLAAGYFRGWVDDLIQYLYTVLTAIPGVLLVAACVLMMQVYLDAHPALFDTMAARADLRLLVLCLILGLTGWAGLCRLLRAETMKLRELEYVQAARVFGVGHGRILRRHLLPNVGHIVLITVVLEFSALVLYEAVLSYLGIGVDPSTPSFGLMIDAARLEMSRDPMIWWSLASAFGFLLVLVLAANIFAEGVQRAFDPRLRHQAPAGSRAAALPAGHGVGALAAAPARDEPPAAGPAGGAP